MKIDDVDVYGWFDDYANFEVIYDDENEDFVWVDRDPVKYPSWKEVIIFLKTKGRSNLVEVSTL